jgi:hypothetical protein
VNTSHKQTKRAAKGARATRKGGNATATASASAPARLNDYASALVQRARDKRARALREQRARERNARNAPRTWRERARARIARARAHFASNRALANHASARAARTAPAPFATSERREVVREIAGGNASHPQRASGARRWPMNARLSRACALVQGRVVYWREGESARCALARIVQPCASAPAQAARVRAASLAPHLSPCERATLDAHTHATVRAIAPAPAPDESERAPAREWHFAAHLSPREQRLKHARTVARKIGIARGALTSDAPTRGALARALRALPRALRASNAARYLRARFALARALQRERRAARGACAIAGQRARFHSLGALVLRERETGKRIGRKAARTLAPASGAESFDATESGAHILRGAFTLDARDGTGRAVEWQAVCEMRLAARAELLAGNDWKAASKATARELHRALREPHFADVESASRAQDRAHARACDAWKSDECARNETQPHALEFCACDDSEAQAQPLAVALAKYRRARAALAAYWLARKDRARLANLAKDKRAVREYLRAELRGVRALVAFRVHRAESADEKRAILQAQSARRLGARVSEGARLLASAPREMETSWEGFKPRGVEAMQRAGAQAHAPRALVTIPRTRAEWYEVDTPALAVRLLARLHARTAHGARAKGEKREGKAASVRAGKARTVRALRAPLPPCALGALAEWQPSAGK